jgi:hypothetical protein
MFKINPFISSLKTNCPPLSELDGIYKRAISNLPPDTRREYCERVINRVQFEMGQAKCRDEIKRLKQLKRAAKLEMAALPLG